MECTIAAQPQASTVTKTPMQRLNEFLQRHSRGSAVSYEQSPGFVTGTVQVGDRKYEARVAHKNGQAVNPSKHRVAQLLLERIAAVFLPARNFLPNAEAAVAGVLQENSFGYNASQLVDYFYKSLCPQWHVDIAWIRVVEDRGCFHATWAPPERGEFQEMLRDAKAEAHAESEILAKARVVEVLCQRMAENIAKFKKIYQKPGSKTPKQLLHEFCAYSGAEACIELTTGDSPSFVGELNVGGRVYRMEYPYYSDHRYCKHKLAVDLLRQAAIDIPEAREFYFACAKRNLFVRGATVKRLESTNTEFKGHADPSTSLTASAVNKKAHEYGRAVCAFLNTNGGSLFIGVHDSGIIQGVQVGNPDDLCRQVQDKITSKLEPHPEGRFFVRAHPVDQIIATLDCPCPSCKADRRQGGVQPCTRLQSLIDEVARLRQILQLDERGIEHARTDRFVVELFCVASAGASRFKYSNKMYIRRGAENAEVEAEREETKEEVAHEAPSQL